MMRALCRLDEIADGTARGFGPAPGGFTGLFAVRRGDRVMIYVNACPHVGVPLDWAPDRFLTADGRAIVCSTHGALFDIDSGRCFDGPCQGDSLESVACRIEDGMVMVPEDAGL
jgi:nitrite reductase/ring-hydroxylating ferredoxin subunit